MVFWKIAVRNVAKNWRHSLSALLSLSASFVSLVLFDGYISELKRMYDDSYKHRSMLGQLLIEKPGVHGKAGLAEPWKFAIFENEQLDIDAFFAENKELVKNRVRFVYFQGMVTNGNQSAIVMGRGYDVAAGERVRGANWSWNATYGLPLHKAGHDFAAMLGQGLSYKLGCTWNADRKFFSYNGGYEPVERPFECPTKDLQISVMTSEGQLNALDLTASGLLDAGYRDIDDRYLQTSLETAQMLMNSKDLSLISVELQNPNDLGRFVDLFNEKFSAKYPELKIMTWKDHPMGETYIKSMDLLFIFRNFMVVVILVISTLSVINTLIKIIKERSREIGTLRSIGFRSKQVVKMFIYETFLLSGIGTFAGFLIALFLTVFLNSLHIRYKAGMLSEPVLFKIEFTVMDYLNAALVLMAVSQAACLFSTRQELNKKVIENLNHV